MHSTAMTARSRRVRVAVAGVLTAGLLGAGAGTAAGAAAPQHPAPPEPVSAHTDPAKAGPDHTDPAHSDPASPVAVTHRATADRHVVKPWQEFHIKGQTKGVKAGSKVVLEQKQRGTWRALPVRTVVHPNGTYSLRVKLGIKGKNELRLLAGGKPSNVVTVTVR